MFGSTYICEQLFLKIKYIKSKSRPKLTDVHVKSLLRLTCQKHVSPEATPEISLTFACIVAFYVLPHDKYD